MDLVKAHGRKAYTFKCDPSDVNRDSFELQLMKARTVRGVSQVNKDEETGRAIIHIQSLGRGPLQCEHELMKALERRTA